MKLLVKLYLTAAVLALLAIVGAGLWMSIDTGWWVNSSLVARVIVVFILLPFVAVCHYLLSSLWLERS